MAYEATNTINTPGLRRQGSGAASGRGAMGGMAGGRGERGGPGHARHEAYDEMHEESSDRVRAGIFAAGIAVGALVGAGVALLFAPHSGEVTRELIARRARHVRSGAGDAWEDLGDELRGAIRRGRRRLARRATRARWAAADMMER